ncbi:histone H2A [Caerostris extrusa]|uniref:Histone H2A n=1 Tax=Caerostris extrusa TaxID=172846 RepID=A0AAV4VS20_CAEEX|nr:histone H2A [Caerostris extrusa]
MPFSKKRSPSGKPGSTPKRQKESEIRQTKRFPLQKIHELMQRKFNGTVKPEASVFLTAILEYLSVEILELSANVARGHNTNNGTIKLALEDTLEAIESDSEIRQLLDKVRKQ